MRLSLQVAPGNGAPFKFDHQGSQLRIGRDPASELALEGDASQSVSWNHARVDLSPSGAYLTDLKSTNGTFLNDKRVHDRVPLHQGDLIQLGYTGPKLKVTELQVGTGQDKRTVHEPRPRNGGVAVQVAAAPGTTTVLTKSLAATRGMLDAVQRTQRNLLVGMSVVGLALLAAVFLLFWKLTRPAVPPAAPVLAKTATTENVADLSSPKEAPAEKQPEKKAPERTDAAAKQPEPKASEPKPAPPRAEPKAVGRYVAENKGPPSVLLQRSHEPEPWARLHPASAKGRVDDRVYTENYLLSLPGYRSRVYLDSGVHMTLWGNIQEFSKFPPVYESTVVLHEPAAGTDLDFTLERGRVLLADFKQSGQARVRIRFHQQAWDVTIPDNNSEVVVELWGVYPPGVPFSTDPHRKGPLAVVGLYIKGRAQLNTGQQEYALGDLQRFVWTNDSSAPMGPDKLPKAPDWWTEKVDTSKQATADMAISLIDLSKALDKTESIPYSLRTEMKESKDVANRMLGVWFLAALDAVQYAVDALEDPQYPELRGAATVALQNWIAHSADHDLELYRTLVEKKDFPKEKAQIIMQLLHDFSVADAGKRKTYEILIDDLSHTNLAVRELALWHLARLAPKVLKEAPYDPAADEDKRKAAVEKWKKLLNDGKLPPERAPQGKAP